MQRYAAVGFTTLAAGGIILACADQVTNPLASSERAPSAPLLAVNSFSCGVSYTSFTFSDDSELAQFGVPARTDTARVCETWTGNDYQIQVTQVGSSEPVSEYSEDMMTVQYLNGETVPYAADGSQMEPGQSVGATSFEFVQATPSEQQASYNDPYYGIAQTLEPGGCPEDPKAIVCSTSGDLLAPHGPAHLSVNPTASRVGRKDHGLRRRALRALLSDREEVGRSAEGFRRFRSVTGDEESIIEIDPATELIRGQEVRGPSSHSRARLSWVLRGNTFVRERMEITSETVRDGKRFGSVAVVQIQDLKFGARAP